MNDEQLLEFIKSTHEILNNLRGDLLQEIERRRGLQNLVEEMNARLAKLIDAAP